MRPKNPVVGIVCSDLHLSLRPPLARTSEPDWLEAMARPLRQLIKLKEEFHVPILCAGDIFDHWWSMPQLVNWLIAKVPYRPLFYAIPGQHDLPYHSTEEIQRSSYWTLVTAGVIEHVVSPYQLGPLLVTGFPFGMEAHTCHREKGMIHVALIHRYVWMGDHSYPGAPPEQNVKQVMKEYSGFDVLAVGDNHRGFTITSKGTTVFNCGTFMRRKSDEIHYHPQVGLIRQDGYVEPCVLDTSEDVIETTSGSEQGDVRSFSEVDRLLGELGALRGAVPDFVEVVGRVLDKKKVSKAVRTIVMEAIEDAKRQ